MAEPLVEYKNVGPQHPLLLTIFVISVVSLSWCVTYIIMVYLVQGPLQDVQDALDQLTEFAQKDTTQLKDTP